MPDLDTPDARYVHVLREQLNRDLLKASNALVSARKCIEQLDKLGATGSLSKDLLHPITEAGLYVAAERSMVDVLL